MKENEFDDLIQSKLSNYSSKTTVSEEEIWRKVSKGISYKSSFITVIKKPWVYISVISIAGLFVFLISNKTGTQKNQPINLNHTICKDIICPDKNDTLHAIDSIQTKKIKSNIETNFEKSKSKVSLIEESQVKEEKNKETIENFVEQNNEIIEKQKESTQTIEPKVEQKIIKKEIQITDTVIKTKRMRKR